MLRLTEQLRIKEDKNSCVDGIHINPNIHQTVRRHMLENTKSSQELWRG
jgi:hypothetical protein